MSDSLAAVPDDRLVSQQEERRVIFASSLGTVFEWYEPSAWATGRAAGLGAAGAFV